MQVKRIILLAAVMATAFAFRKSVSDEEFRKQMQCVQKVIKENEKVNGAGVESIYESFYDQNKKSSYNFLLCDAIHGSFPGRDQCKSELVYLFRERIASFLKRLNEEKKVGKLKHNIEYKCGIALLA